MLKCISEDEVMGEQGGHAAPHPGSPPGWMLWMARGCRAQGRRGDVAGAQECCSAGRRRGHKTARKTHEHTCNTHGHTHQLATRTRCFAEEISKEQPEARRVAGAGVTHRWLAQALRVTGHPWLGGRGSVVRSWKTTELSELNKA